MTSWWGWARRRARASTGLLLTLLALVTATTAILAGAVGYSGAAATTAAREALAGAVPDEAGIRVQTRQAPDPDAQDAAARRLIDAAFAPAPVSVQRTVVSTPRPVSLDGARLEGALVALASTALEAGAEGVGERVDLVEGAWPSASAASADNADNVEGMLHAGTAAEWGVAVGDTLDVGGTPVLVSGLWRPVDAADAFWFGDQLVAAGRDGDDRGPLVVAPGAVARLVDAPFVRWTVQPDASDIQPDDLAHLAAAAGALRTSLKTPEVEVRGVTVDGDLAPTAATAAHNLATANALGVIPLSVLALVTLLSVTQLARLLSTTREAQAQLLVARGASRAQVLVSTLAESALVTALGAGLGALAAWGALQAVPAGDGQGGTVLRVAALTGLAVLVVLSAVAVLQVWRLTTGGRADLSGRTRAATALATLVLVLGAAGVAWWQLSRTGSPLVTAEDGSLGTDLVAGAAPALLLAAAAVVAMTLLGPLARAVEALTRPSRAASGHLAAAQVSRRLPVYGVPAVLTVLAVGATTLSGLYAGTSATLRDNLTAVAQGAPVRATLDEPPRTVGAGVVPPPPSLPAELAGVRAATPVWVESGGRLGDLTLPVTMASVDELAQVITADDLPGVGALVPAALAGEVRAPEGVALPPGTTSLTIDLDVDLTISEQGLAGVQANYEGIVADVIAGRFGVAQPDEELARDEARMMIDSGLVPPAEPLIWQVALRVVDSTGLYHEVQSDRVEIDLPGVSLPWSEAVAAGERVSDVDYTRAQVSDGGGAGTLTFTLPEGVTHTLVGVVLSTPLQSATSWLGVPPEVEVELGVTTGAGEPLLGEATAAWGSADVPADALDSSGTRWLLRTPPPTFLPERITVAPGLSSLDDTAPAPGVRPPAATPAPPTDVPAIPVALTEEAARAALLSPGDRAELNAFGGRLPVTVAAVVPAVPGTLAPQAALLDRDAVAAHLAGAGRTLTFPTELWAMPQGWAGPDGGAGGAEAAQVVVEQLAADPTVASVTGPGRVAVTDATSAARLVFWVASAGAVLLAVTGIGAVAATLLGHRRPEVAVLRALGMPARAQARSRALELGGVVLASIVLGLAASWLVGRAVVPELASSTTQPGQVRLPSPLLLEPGPWALLLGIGLVCVLVVVLAQARRVSNQALDRDYREEIR